jgi:hypothetical protein
MPRLLTSLWLLASLLLAACAERVPEPPAAAENAAPTTQTPPTTPAPVSAPANDDVPAGGTPPTGTSDRDLARLDGYGPLRFGMTVEEMNQAWGAPLDAAMDAEQAGACHHLNPVGQGAQPYLAFMVDGGRFVRYSTSSDVLLAPGGGRRGMREAELQALYGNALQSAPHEYVDGGKYLSLDTSGVAPTRLVFETDENGIVEEWRVGVSPQVDYVEGCA